MPIPYSIYSGQKQHPAERSAWITASELDWRQDLLSFTLRWNTVFTEER